jgi:hypothetical protein
VNSKINESLYKVNCIAVIAKVLSSLALDSILLQNPSDYFAKPQGSTEHSFQNTGLACRSEIQYIANLFSSEVCWPVNSVNSLFHCQSKQERDAAEF